MTAVHGAGPKPESAYFMGQEINRTWFSADDWLRFAERLNDETQLLHRFAREQRLSQRCCSAGFELEAWLVDRHYCPAPTNTQYLAALDDPLVVPELSRFNVEINGTPQRLRERAFSHLETELLATWRRCLDVAQALDSALVLIGILPTIRESHLTMANVSPLKRYEALNAQILQLRGGRPLVIDIEGAEHLHTEHRDVMLEAATTSFQVHLQVPARDAARFYNASLIAAAPVVAVAANSPFLFEHLLWAETRIPLFEQAVAAHAPDADPADWRVSFGAGYLHELGEYFIDNQRRFPVVLPIESDGAPETFAHLRLHNGTIWRWNRLLIGFDGDGSPHVRIEHRVLPAGPSIHDMLANAAFYIGLVNFLVSLHDVPEDGLPFPAARTNFYAAARDGLDARVSWIATHEADMRDLLLMELLPMARHGLQRLRIAPEDIAHYLGTVEARVRSGRTGAAWQRAWVEAHGRDFVGLCAAYYKRQQSGAPVHEWEI
jgi:hypothetical protein